MTDITLTHIALHVKDVAACVAFYQHFCNLEIVARRPSGDEEIIWMGKPAEALALVLVMLPRGPGHQQADNDFSHLGFAVDSRQAVDEIAARAARAGCLAWQPVEEPFPVGYYCGLRDPDGNFVEFSFGQPLGPGAPPLAALSASNRSED